MEQINFAVQKPDPAFILIMRMSNGIVEHEVAREVLLSGTLATAEPTGFEFSLTSVNSFCCPSRKTLSQAACTGAIAWQSSSSRHLTTVYGST